MTLSDHLDRIQHAAADRDGQAGTEALADLETDCGPLVAAVVTADLIAYGVRVLRERAAAGDTPARELLDRAAALGYAR
jgi:hypothetical protein